MSFLSIVAIEILKQGLFQRAIAESGVAISPWALAVQPKQRAFDLGRELGIDTNSTAELLGYLRATPSELLVKAGARLIAATGTAADLQSTVALPFVPVIEPDLPGAFLTKNPREALPGSDIPLLTGYNAQEGIILFRRLQRYPKLLSELNREFIRAVPSELKTEDRNRTETIAQAIRTFYFQNRTIDLRNVDTLINLFTDVMFLRPALETLRIQAASNRTSPTYFYRFAFDGALGLFKRMLGINHPGACHGDEMGYLFYFSRLNYRLDDNSTELGVSRRMVQLWTNFAKTGNPTPPVDYQSIIDFTWPAVTDIMNVTYLDMDAKFSIHTQPEEERIQFWDNLYQMYGNNF